MTWLINITYLLTYLLIKQTLGMRSMAVTPANRNSNRNPALTLTVT